jgi:hypothetical protein
MPDKTEPKPYTYHVSYSMEVHPEGISKEELQAKNRGGSDALFVVSILYPPDGSYSAMIRSVDGRTGEEMTDKEFFKLWALLAHRLGKSETLDEGRRGFAATTFAAFCESVKISAPDEHHCAGCALCDKSKVH